ncbi:MAG TPA: peptidoglycan editing factor PgeF [Salinivirgaceae bacterium]|nr:peptidoglycan editing factor PgeF [Salinivirgaceae bacterium]
MKFDPINNAYSFEIFETIGLKTLVTTRNSFGHPDFNLTLKRQSSEERQKKIQMVQQHLKTEFPIVFPHQISKDNIWIIDHDKTPQEADAVISNRRDIGIGILTADCLPIILCDPQTKYISLIHAGWRGVLANLTTKTIVAMSERGCTPRSMLAAIGPSISPAVYEVGLDVSELFFNAGYSKYLKVKNREKYYLDLWGIVLEQLTNNGILAQNIEFSNLCSYQNPAFYSARRDGANTGRFATIALWQ